MASPRRSLPSEAGKAIEVRGARANNLKDISVAIPKGRLTAVSGPSGSGKSSLVFGVLYEEARRRWQPTLDGGLPIEVPPTDWISGLSFPVAVQPKVIRSGRTSVATQVGIYPILSELFFHLGEARCTACGGDVVGVSPREIAEALLTYSDGSTVELRAPVGLCDLSGVRSTAERLRHHGLARMRAGETVLDLGAEHFYLELEEPHVHCFAVIDRLRLKRSSGPRLLEAVEMARQLGSDSVIAEIEMAEGTSQVRTFSLRFACLACAMPQPEIHRTDFFYYTSRSACPVCDGQGVISEANLSWSVPTQCQECDGARVKPHVRTRVLGGSTFGEVFTGTADRALKWLSQLLERRHELSSDRLGKGGQLEPALIRGAEECRERLQWVVELGAGYLELHRALGSLSGGEQQRLALVRELAGHIHGVLYLIEEPSAGLHPSDVARLLAALEKLLAKDGTVVVTEHDPALLRQVDYLIDLGPGSGAEGGQVCAAGTLEEVRISGSASAPYLAPNFTWPKAPETRQVLRNCMTVVGASKHTLQDIDVHFPLQAFTVVTGVSGSGKSTLLFDCLAPALRSLLEVRNTTGLASPIGPAAARAFGVARVEGWESLAVLVETTERIGKLGYRSTVATLAGAMAPLRALYAMTPDAKVRGLTPRHFSFNCSEGACPHCFGKGVETVRAARVELLRRACRSCGGRRFAPATLAVRYRDRSIGDTLALTAEAALGIYQTVPGLQQVLQAMVDFGLGYLTLQQSGPTLSAGELQRLSLLRHVLRRGSTTTLFLFDEPTQGLHPTDIESLILLFRRLTAAGHTVIAVEHNRQLISAADFEIELGPGAGPAGGRLVRAPG
ncbi:MAG: hypothetical protein KDD69_01125 [Bdellovibrionales bacterium]|nr:hypothetical protein [Bdellovibrionales bacterium]